MKAIYIAGARNCGSTLLDAILGAAPGARSLGEVAGFHRYQPGRACACQTPSEACGPCGAVVAAVDWDELTRQSARPLRERRWFWTLVGTRGRAAYARQADDVFDAVAEATGATTLIDSSKNVSRAAALAHDSRHDVRVVHVIRDGRGYLRSRRARAAVDGRRYLGPPELIGWLAKNLLISSLLARRLPPDRYLLIRYENLVADPATELKRIGAFADLDTDGLAEAAVGPGVARLHLFEPVRRTDYRTVRLDPSRLDGQRWPPGRNRRYWALGGFVSARWGYDRAQSYLG